jgi:hypothetical protein
MSDNEDVKSVAKLQAQMEYVIKTLEKMESKNLAITLALLAIIAHAVMQIIQTARGH